MSGNGKRRWWIIVLPSALSGLRLVLAVAFPLLADGWRLAAVAASGLSDWLDGLLARRLGAATWWGALIDPISDKLFTVTALTTLTIEHRLALWELVLLLARDLSVFVVSVFLAATGHKQHVKHVEARPLGKATTVAFFGLLAGLLLAVPVWLQNALFAIAALLSAASAIDYALTVQRLHAQAVANSQKRSTLPP